MQVIPEATLERGAFGLKWAARAGDSHPRVGTITFTVEAAALPSLVGSRDHCKRAIQEHVGAVDDVRLIEVDIDTVDVVWPAR